MKKDIKRKTEFPALTWDIDVPILTSTPVMKQLGFALGFSILFVVLLMFLIGLFSGDLDQDYLIFLGKLFLLLAAIFAALLLLAVLLFMGNRYGYTFTVDNNGVGEAPCPRQHKKNTFINTALIIAGIFTGRPGAAGAGMLAQSRQKQFLRWEKIDEIVPDFRRKTIVLKIKGRTRMVVFCTPEHFDAVLEIIRSRT